MLNKLKLKRRQSTKSSDDRLTAVKRNIYARSIGLAVFVVLVTVTLLFAVTTAWYTNTITAGGLTFKAEAWGFDGTVSVSETAIEAAPGDEGVVELRVKNTSDLASSIGVSISKEYMEEAEMQKRIYFYVDKSSVVNGETVEKLYLNNTTGYSYTLYGHNELILSEQLHTGVLIRWQWVYDVVGYYFVGELDSVDGAPVVTVKEYLRPVEYSYDDATYEVDNNSEDDVDRSSLLTVDGETTVAQFLAELTASDGYIGEYSQADDGTLMYNGEAVNISVPNCYPIDSENNVWVYLCTKSEIEANTWWDTQYGTTAESEKPSYQARITVTGEQLNQKVVTLESTADLADALNNNSGEIVRLSEPVMATETIVIGKAATDTEEAVTVNALLDLNGCSINVNDSEIKTLFSVGEGSSLTLFNGSITGVDGNKTIAVKSVGSDVTLSNVEVNDIDVGVRIEDNTGNGANSTVIISDSTLNTSDCSVIINGDGGKSSAMTQLVVQNSTLISKTYVGIGGNGNSGENGNWGTNIQIVNSTVEGYYAAIYHPQRNSILSVSSSTLRGITGVIIKGGYISIADSKVIGTADDSNRIIVVPTEDRLGNSGSLDTGDGIYIESNYGYPISLTVSGDSEISHTASISRAVRVFPEASHVSVELTGGTYSSDVSSFVDTEVYTCTQETVEVTEGETTTTKTVYKVEEKETVDE